MALSGSSGVRWSSLISGLVAAAVAARGGFKLLDLKGAIFFFVVFGASFLVSDTLLNAWASILGPAAIFAIVLATILVGQPFTTPYAKEMTPPAVWETATFKRANLVISLGWLAGFGVALAAGLWIALMKTGRPWLQPTAQIVAVVGPLLFQNWYRRRLPATDAD